MPDAQMTEASSRRTTHLQRIGAILIVLLVTVAVVLLRDRLAQYERYGYLGVFVATLLGSATIVLPVPGLAIVYVGGSIWNPILVGLVGGLGDAMGEATGYLTGYAGQELIENQRLYTRFEDWMRRKGFLTILLLSAVPNPFFDLAGIAAGALMSWVFGLGEAAWRAAYPGGLGITDLRPALILIIGTYVSLFLLIAAIMILWGVRSMVVILLNALLTPLFVYLIFTKLFLVQFPSGILF